MDPLISIVMPVRNEAGHVEKAVADALQQEHEGTGLEVIVAVGPSKDGTEAIVQVLAAQHPEVIMIENPAGVVPHGLNAAIRAARGRFIVRMDAHSRYPKDYAKVLTQALDRLGADNVGGVWETLPANETDKAWAIAAVLSSRVGVGNAHFRIGVEGEREVDTVPYGCFRRELFDRIGFFDEELLRNQDDEHNGRITQHGGRIFLLPQVRIQYFTRDTISKLWRMYREYGLFKPLVNIKLGSPATWRQFVPPVFVLGMILGPVVGAFWPLAGWMWSGAVVPYLAVILLVSLRTASAAGRFGAFPWMVLAFFTVHWAYGIGYWQGFFRFVVLGRRTDPKQLGTNR